MPIIDIGSHVTTGSELESHWLSLNAQRVADGESELIFSDGYAVSDLTIDIAMLSSALTDVVSLENDVSIAMASRESSRIALRLRLIDFRRAVAYWLRGTIYPRSLPRTPHQQASQQKLLRALDDMADLWKRINADAGSPDFTPPLVLRGGYSLATFNADVSALRDIYAGIHTAENDLRFARNQRDRLLKPLRDRLASYRVAVRIEYGAEHPFSTSLPKVYS